jgi:hypothetical protein
MMMLLGQVSAGFVRIILHKWCFEKENLFLDLACRAFILLPEQRLADAKFRPSVTYRTSVFLIHDFRQACIAEWIKHGRCNGCSLTSVVFDGSAGRGRVLLLSG